jgi:hypothetical protein
MNWTEKAVIEAVLALGSNGASSRFAPRLEGLRVIDRCDCGCASVDFAPPDPARPAKPIGKGVGTTRAGDLVGVIVWGRENEVTALEIHDFGSVDTDLRLPDPASIRAVDDGHG